MKNIIIFIFAIFLAWTAKAQTFDFGCLQSTQAVSISYGNIDFPIPSTITWNHIFHSSLETDIQYQTIRIAGWDGNNVDYDDSYYFTRHDPADILDVICTHIGTDKCYGVGYANQNRTFTQRLENGEYDLPNGDYALWSFGLKSGTVDLGYSVDSYLPWDRRGEDNVFIVEGSDISVVLEREHSSGLILIPESPTITSVRIEPTTISFPGYSNVTISQGYYYAYVDTNIYFSQEYNIFINGTFYEKVSLDPKNVIVSTYSAPDFNISSSLETMLRSIKTSLNPPDQTPVDSGPLDGKISYEDAGRLTQIAVGDEYSLSGTLDLSIFRNLVAIELTSNPDLTEIIFPDHGKEFWDFRIYSNDLRTIDMSNINLRDNPNTFGAIGNFNLSCIKVRDLDQVEIMGWPDTTGSHPSSFITWPIYVGERSITSLPYRYQITYPSGYPSSGSHDFTIQTTDCN